MPADVDGTVVEQRILEQSVRIPPGGALTAWAALRWRGGHYFDGIDRFTRALLPVTIVLGGWQDIGRDARIDVSRERFWWDEIEIVDDVPCAITERAVMDELRRGRSVRWGVVALEMAVAAGLVTFESFAAYVTGCNGWTGVPFVRKVIDWAGGDVRSPPEALLRMMWKYDAGFAEPLCNTPVFDLSGRLLGHPDLFDPVAGVVGEYGGFDHTETDRRRADREREDRLVAHGLSYFEVVTGDLGRPHVVVERMRKARERALFLPAEQRRWTLETPPWWRSRYG